MLNSRNFATYIINGGEDVCVVDTDTNTDIPYICLDTYTMCGVLTIINASGLIYVY